MNVSRLVEVGGGQIDKLRDGILMVREAPLQVYVWPTYLGGLNRKELEFFLLLFFEIYCHSFCPSLYYSIDIFCIKGDIMQFQPMKVCFLIHYHRMNYGKYIALLCTWLTWIERDLRKREKKGRYKLFVPLGQADKARIPSAKDFWTSLPNPGFCTYR